MRTIAKILRAGIPVLFFALAALPCRAQFRTLDPVQVPGSLLSALHGRSLDRLRLLSLRQGALLTVPCQFDERLADGSFVLELGESNRARANHKLDALDFLVFRARDAGARAEPGLWPPNTIEIELREPAGPRRAWAYLAFYPGAVPPPARDAAIKLVNSNPFERGDLPFTVQGETYLIEGMVNRIRGRFYKTAVNRSLYLLGPHGRSPNLLDGMRMRAHAEMLFGQVRMDADETNMIGGIASLRQGPIRGLGRQWMTFSLPLGLSGPRIYSDVFTYDRMVVAPMKINIPFNPEALFTRASIEFGYDFSEAAYGMRFYSPHCLEGVTIDGRMSAREKKMSRGWVPWYLVTGPLGSLIFRVQVDPRLLRQVKCGLTFIDDREQAFPPERLRGSIGYGRISIEMESVKAGDYPFRIEWYFPPDLYRPGGFDRGVLQQYLDITDAPLIIAVGKKTAPNQALSPPPLAPG